MVTIVEHARQWAAGALLAIAFGAGVAGGCGSSSEAVRTSDPAVTFAPLVRFAPSERWFPMSARWFIDRSVLRWSANLLCPDPKIAAGAETSSPVADGLPLLRARGLGKGPPYRFSETTPECRRQGPARYLANHHNRPYDVKDEAISMAATEGFYLDLDDEARTGEHVSPRREGLQVGAVPVYTESTRTNVRGERGLKLSYWMLYGLHQAGAYGPRFWEATHEGDWERVDVLLEHPSDDAYIPVAVRVRYEGRRRQLGWDQMLLGGEDGSHPVLSAERGTHQMSPARRQACSGCMEWSTWNALEPLDDQPWEGFGGAWGEWGPDGARSGPLGPHGGPEPLVDRVPGAAG